MSHKEKVAKRTALFSLKTYLRNKAVHKAEKLQYRAAKRNGTLPQQHAHVHTHDHDHAHEHAEELLDEEPLVINEDDLAQLPG